MALIVTVFQFTTIFIMYLVFKSTYVDSNEDACSFPQQSIACKVWNYTNMDCSWRELDCIPSLRQKASLELLDLTRNKLAVLPKEAFSALIKLQTLNLSLNNISAINGGAFIGLNKLKTLDLTFNMMSTIDGDTFSGLNLLQTLNVSRNVIKSLPDNVFSGFYNLLSLDLNGNYISSVSNRTFTKLQGKLTMLSLWNPRGFNHYPLNFASDSPFQYLRSLQILTLGGSDVTVTPTTFAGLDHTLQVLSISINSTTTDTPFIQLSSLQELELAFTSCIHVNEKLFAGLGKLKYLKIQDYGTLISGKLKMLKCIVNFSPLVSLTYLRYWQPLVNDLKLYSLNSPLLTMELHNDFKSLWINSSTFESLPKWKESLQELSIYYEYPFSGQITIEGSPFKWFPQLQRLRIRGFPPTFGSTTSWTSPGNIFKGLANNLKEVHLNYLNIDEYIAYDLITTFTTYNSLKVLDMKNNEIYPGFIKYPAMMANIRKITTLETIDFSDNEAGVSYGIPILDLGDLCSHNISNLKTLNMADFGLKLQFQANIKFPYLVSFHSSNSIVAIGTPFFPTVFHAPRLEELCLSGINIQFSDVTSAIKVLKFFNAPQLKTLDLSSNEISQIDKEDADRLSKLTYMTYLDLKNTTLISLSNLNYLYNVEVLFLSNNKIVTVPTSFLSNTVLQLEILDLHANNFACDCSIERFQKWVLTDDVTYLWNKKYFSLNSRYKCAVPPSSEGLSITAIELDCEVPLLMYISVGVSSGLVTMIAAILVIRYRWHIRYRLFLLFNRRPYQNYLINDDDVDDFEDEDGVPRYDAYVIYQNQDEDWVDEQLLANIEEDHEEPFRLCLKNRDIRAGRLIFNELSLHIRRSRKTLVILTPRFIEDNWRYFQLNMAHHRVLEENHNVLIFIILEEIPDKRLTLLLRQLFCKSQCLKWPNDEYGQNLFWQRLREELKRPVPRDRIHRYRRYNI